MSAPRGAIWPGSREQALLAAGLLPAREALAAWSQWRESIDLDDVPVAELRLIPLASRNLGARLEGDPDARRVRGIYRNCWVRNQLLLATAAPAVAALEAEGVPTLLAKGAGIVASGHRDAGSRWMADVDVVVPPDRADLAHHVLREAGWIDHHGRPSELMATTHGSAYENADGQLIDLHWRAFWLPASDDRLWADARPAQIAGIESRVPSPADMLLHACVHGATWVSGGQFDWIADAHVLASTAGGADWEALVAGARARRIQAFVVPVLEYLATRLASPVPDALVAELSGDRVPLRTRAAYRALLRPTRAAGHLPIAWDVYRRHRDAGVPGPRAASFVEFLRRSFGYDSSRELAAGGVRLALRRRRGRASGRSGVS